MTSVAAFDDELPLDTEAARRLLAVAARACPNSDQAASGGSGNGQAAKRPPVHATDAAVLEAARKIVGADESWTLEHELPFETSRGYSASLGTFNGHSHLAVKGAPEIVLEQCGTILTGEGDRTPLPRRHQSTELSSGGRPR